MNDDEKAIEALAAYAHEVWSGWMRYMFGKGTVEAIVTPEGKEALLWTMPEASFERWQRQMNTSYADLPESEKASDRDEAKKMLAIMNDKGVL